MTISAGFHFKNRMMRKLYFVLFLVFSSLPVIKAQTVVYTQTFEDTNKLFNGYVLSNLDQGTPADTLWKALADSAWIVRQVGDAGNHAALATSAYSAAKAADDWFITPAIRVGKASKLTWESLSLTHGTTDTYQIFISTSDQSVGGCLINFPVADFTSNQSDGFVQNTLDLANAGFADRKVFIGFRLTTVEGGDKLAIDNISVTEDSTHFVSLVFSVNMSNYIAAGKFDPRADTVDLAGTFNNWQGTDNILSIVPDTDSTVYATTVFGFVDGDQLEFKFRINSTWDDSIVEFPYGQPNRLWTVEKDIYTYSCYYNNQGTAFGTTEASLLDEVNVFPNPAGDFAVVDLPDGLNRLMLINPAGSKILELHSITHSRLMIDLSFLSQGTYFLLFYSKNEYIGSKKLIKY